MRVIDQWDLLTLSEFSQHCGEHFSSQNQDSTKGFQEYQVHIHKYDTRDATYMYTSIRVYYLELLGIDTIKIHHVVLHRKQDLVYNTKFSLQCYAVDSKRGQINVTSRWS